MTILIVMAAALAASPAADTVSRSGQLAEAERLILSSGMSARYDAVLPQLIETMVTALLPGNEGRQKELRIIVAEELNTTYRKLKPAFMAKAASIYAQHFTSLEITHLAEFFSSPLGQKYLEGVTDMRAQLMAYNNDVIGRTTQESAAAITERMRDAKMKVPEKSAAQQ